MSTSGSSYISKFNLIWTWSQSASKAASNWCFAHSRVHRVQRIWLPRVTKVVKQFRHYDAMSSLASDPASVGVTRKQVNENHGIEHLNESDLSWVTCNIYIDAFTLHYSKTSFMHKGQQIKASITHWLSNFRFVRSQTRHSIPATITQCLNRNE